MKIGEIIKQNPWWKHGKSFTGYDRHLSKVKKELIYFERRGFETSKENIYVIRGCRQTGKTTYLKKWVEKLVGNGFDSKLILYLSLDFFTSRKEMRSAINYFMDINREAESLYILLDELTSIKDWNLELKYLWDSGVTKRAVIVATGSSGAALRRKGELLPGRGLEGNEYYLKPLSFREFVLQTVDYMRNHVKTKEFYNALGHLKFNLEKVSINLKWNLNEILKVINTVIPFKKELEYLFRIYLVTGGFPGIINNHLRKKFAGEKELVDFTLAEMFVRNVLGDIVKQGRQEAFARQMLREIIEKYGTRYTFSKLARDIEISHATTIDYLELLKDSFILTILHAFDFNKQKPKFKGGKKIYFQDPFIFHALKSFLTGIDINEVITETLEDEESLSKIVEGIVNSHLVLTQETPVMRETPTFLWFYYNTSNREIDNIMKVDKSFLGIETKYKGRVKSRDILKIPQIKKYIVLSKEDIEFKGDTLVVPTETFLVLLTKSNHNL